MRIGLQRRGFGIATILMAALGCLQPGIDPVFLTLLSAAHHINPTYHGWIVGATQSGMAVGSMIVWRAGPHMPRAAVPMAALAALLASLGTMQVADISNVIALRATYGFAMGIVYTYAMSSAAGFRPNGAYGAVFLVQLILSTLVALILPPMAQTNGPGPALILLALAPASALFLAILIPNAPKPNLHDPIAPAAPETRYPTPLAGWALAAASLLFICTTMMVWSFTGALATAAGIGQETLGRAVALGSIAGALTAASVMREKPLIPLPITGVLAGIALFAPIILTSRGDGNLFILSIIFLNIGSTAIIIRCSGMATAQSRDPLFRRLVACTHPLGMIMGPVIGSIMTIAMGDAGLRTGAAIALFSGCVALLLAQSWQSKSVGRPLGLNRLKHAA